MIDQDEAEELPVQIANRLSRYIRQNPLATVAGVLVLGMLLARFAFFGNPKDAQ